MMQHTDEWIAARLGKATASRIGDLMAKTKTLRSPSAARSRVGATKEETLVMKTVSYLTLVTAICVVITAPRSASAQCVYRMIDVGRPHGYLSGPCRGAELNLAGAYPSRAVKKEPSPRAKKVR